MDNELEIPKFCKYCQGAYHGNPVRYKNDKGKIFEFCTDDCARYYYESRGIYLMKIGGAMHKIEKATNFLNKLADLFGN